MLLKLVLASLCAAAVAVAETHTIHFENKCGYGTPMLRDAGRTLSTGADYTINGRLISAIAFLQTGNCGENGENCTLVETTLMNPTSPGSGSGSDILLISPYTFSVPSGFMYKGAGCDGTGADCATPDCPAAARDGNQLQTVCFGDNVNLTITFCD